MLLIVLTKLFQMKTFLFSILAVIALWSCNSGNATEAPKAGDVTSIQWIDSVKNVGAVDEGQVVDIAFRFKNTGTKPLVIQDVKASCGCTVPAPPKEPIAPGQEGEIKASFNSQGRPGMNNKTLTVYANTGSAEHRLSFSVEVKPKPAEAPKQ